MTAVSDPNFPDQLLDTSFRASKIGVARSLSLRISPTIEMAFGDVPKSLQSLGELEAAATPSLLDLWQSNNMFHECPARFVHFSFRQAIVGVAARLMSQALQPDA